MFAKVYHNKTANTYYESTIAVMSKIMCLFVKLFFMDALSISETTEFYIAFLFVYYLHSECLSIKFNMVFLHYSTNWPLSWLIRDKTNLRWLIKIHHVAIIWKLSKYNFNLLEYSNQDNEHNLFHPVKRRINSSLLLAE